MTSMAALLVVCMHTIDAYFPTITVVAITMILVMIEMLTADPLIPLKQTVRSRQQSQDP